MNSYEDGFSELLIEVGRRVKLARNREGISQEVLAERAGVSRSRVAAIEANKGSLSLAALYRVCRALDYSIAGLLIDEELE